MEYLYVSIPILIGYFVLFVYGYWYGLKRGSEEILEKRDLFETQDSKVPIGQNLLIKRTYKNGATRIIRKKIMF